MNTKAAKWPAEKVTLERLYDIVRLRAQTKPDGSYTAKLLDQGIEKCAKKVGEEAVEVALAATSNNREHFIGEVADLQYHLFVLMEARGVTLSEVEHLLALRHAQMTGDPKADKRGT